MEFDDDVPGDIGFQDWMGYLRDDFGRENWLTVYRKSRGKWGASYCYCALIPSSQTEAAMANESWDLFYGHGLPGCSVSYGGNGQTVRYHRFGTDSRIEPLIYDREFHGVEPDYPEVCEEFRLLHNLYCDAQHQTYSKVDDSGFLDPVIRIDQVNQVSIRLKPLKQFLSIKQMYLAVYFSIERYSDEPIPDLERKPRRHTVKQHNLLYHHILSRSYSDDHAVTAMIEGKKLIAPMPVERSGVWPYEERPDHPIFVIGIDENGEDVSHSCDPDGLANNFGANQGAPHYLIPVYFRRDGLQKYYSNTELYTVDDGHITCAGLWNLRMDNNLSTHVMVFLGDLGHLPPAEQKYWSSFNVMPSSEISETNWRRSFLGEWADPQVPDLVFKTRFEHFNECWRNTFCWDLFLPLKEDDRHHLKDLRVPVTDSQGEFDQQALNLSKILVDSINERQIASEIDGPIPKDVKGIGKLEIWLKQLNVTGVEEHVKFLRSLQDLRNGAGHRKGDGYTRGLHFFVDDGRIGADTFREVLNHAVELLDFLSELLR